MSGAIRSGGNFIFRPKIDYLLKNFIVFDAFFNAWKMHVNGEIDVKLRLVQTAKR